MSFRFLSGSNFLLLQAVPSPKMQNFPFVYTLESQHDLNFRPYFQLLTYSPEVTTAGSATYLMWQILLGLNWKAFICQSDGLHMFLFPCILVVCKLMQMKSESGLPFHKHLSWYNNHYERLTLVDFELFVVLFSGSLYLYLINAEKISTLY